MIIPEVYLLKSIQSNGRKKMRIPAVSAQSKESKMCC